MTPVRLPLAELLPELAGDLARYKVARRAASRSDDRRSHRPHHTGAFARRRRSSLQPSSGSRSPRRLADRAQALRHGYASGAAADASPGTTHISVIDADGNAAAFSSTLGSGSGIFRGGTQLNNMLGELDVVGGGEPRSPARGSPSMMTPTLVLDEGRPRLALGSAGSVRLAGAIAQVADAVLRGIPVAEAIERPRIHVDGDDLHLEGGWLRVRAESGWNAVRWAGRNLFFGGVAAVERRADGTLAAAGDPRRGGHGIVVE